MACVSRCSARGITRVMAPVASVATPCHSNVCGSKTYQSAAYAISIKKAIGLAVEKPSRVKRCFIPRLPLSKSQPDQPSPLSFVLPPVRETVSAYAASRSMRRNCSRRSAS